jgi:hypothetical protein
MVTDTLETDYGQRIPVLSIIEVKKSTKKVLYHITTLIHLHFMSCDVNIEMGGKLSMQGYIFVTINILFFTASKR